MLFICTVPHLGLFAMMIDLLTARSGCGLSAPAPRSSLVRDYYSQRQTLWNERNQLENEIHLKLGEENIVVAVVIVLQGCWLHQGGKA